MIIKNKEINFPYKAKENGECEMLIGNKCKVYKTRPLICNIDELIKTLHVKRKDFYKENIQECNKMMDEDNIPKKYRIKMTNT